MSSLNSYEMFHNRWALVTARKGDDFNTMTISWGEIGALWEKPVVTVYVKPCRYTYEFMESDDYFTVAFFSEEYRQDLGYLGRNSGRHEDKLAKTSLTPKMIEHGVTYDQAEITIVAKKIYYDDLKLERIPDFAVKANYLTETPHRMYIGEIIAVIGE